LTFFHPILIFQATYWATMDSRAPLLSHEDVTNMIWLLLPVSDSSIIMFGTGGLLLVICGLLLVISHLFAVPASVLWAGLEKKWTWMWEIFLYRVYILGDAVRLNSTKNPYALSALPQRVTDYP
jgi:hypothetical protein